MCACIFMPSPFLEGCPKILLTRVLVSKIETGTEFYNYLTLYLKCSINLLSFIVKKKSTRFFFQLHLKGPCLLSCQFLSVIPTVRGTQPPVKGSDLGQKDLRGFKENGCLTVLSHFCLFLPEMCVSV